MKTALTERRAVVLAAVCEHWAAHGYAPTLRWVGLQTGITSLNGVLRHIDALVRKGVVLRKSGTARSIRPASQDTARAALLAECERLRRSQEFTRSWWAARFERLRDLAREHDIESEFCTIAANGTADPMEPPTYSQMLSAAEQEQGRLRKALGRCLAAAGTAEGCRAVAEIARDALGESRL